jgi:hypothetical protein
MLTRTHNGLRPFYQKSNYLAQLILGPYLVQIWSRNTPESDPNALVIHRVDSKLPRNSWWLGHQESTRIPVGTTPCPSGWPTLETNRLCTLGLVTRFLRGPLRVLIGVLQEQADMTE